LQLRDTAEITRERNRMGREWGSGGRGRETEREEWGEQIIREAIGEDDKRYEKG
jgi:hypothetical protein